MNTAIEHAKRGDLADVVKLYNHHIANTPVTFHTDCYSEQERAEWFNSHTGSGPHQLLVARLEGQFAGFAHSSAYSDRQAYASSVKLSVYLDDARRGQGLGTALYGRLIEALRKTGAHRAYGGVTLPNPASERLHDKLGFSRVGTLNEVGHKFGRYWDVALYELVL